jgi:hypothetical protein
MAVALSVPLLPPVTRTLPSGRSVALCCFRLSAMGATACQAGVAAVRSITSAVFVGFVGLL